MEHEQEATQRLEELKRLSQYCSELLRLENIDPTDLYSRKAYTYSLFIFGLSFVDGLITLAERGQARSMEPLVRGLQEAWINSMFVYSTRCNVWMYYLLLQDELQTAKKHRQFYADGKIEKVRYEKRSKESRRMISLIDQRYKELPLIPKVITVKDQSLHTRKLNLKQRCQIIDHYRSLKPRKSKTTLISQIEHYELVYGHLSGTSHVTPLALNSLYRRDSSGNLSVDISGGNDRRYMGVLLMNGYLYYYWLMRLFLDKVAADRHPIPDDIKASRRRIMAKRLTD